MMQELPGEWGALMFLVFTLGARHGLDADHLATIDGLARHNAAAHPRLARWCGALFSLGHGLVVTLVAAVLGVATDRIAVPQWLDDVGAWISISFLLLLGVLNLGAVLATPQGEIMATVGFMSKCFARLQRTSHPALVAAIGALFALSFDTMSQTALFALTATHFGGIGHALALGLIFTTGMLLTDALNGLWIARLLRRADQAACIASRVMGLTVAAVSLVVALLGIGNYFSPAVNMWSENTAAAMSAGVVLVSLLGFGLALGSARVTRSRTASGMQPWSVRRQPPSVL